MIRLLLACAACLLLAGCGSKGSSNDQRPSNPPPVDTQPAITDAERKRRYGELLYGFFYSDFEQMAETRGWTNYVHIAHNDQYGLNLMAEAVKQGFTNLILTVGSFGFEGQRYRGSLDARARLRDFFSRVKTADPAILECVLGLYTCDEPNGPTPISGSDLTAFCADIRAVAAEYGLDHAGLWIIYGGRAGAGNSDRPGLAAHDVIGIDDYGLGMGVLEQYRALDLRDDQRVVCVPQCAVMDGRGPDDPMPWLNAAVENKQCIGIMAFDWVGYPDGAGLRGASQESINLWRAVGTVVCAQH